MRNKRSRVISTGKNSSFDRVSTLTLEVSSYGTSDQHNQTIQEILKELDIRGFNVKVINGGQ